MNVSPVLVHKQTETIEINPAETLRYMGCKDTPSEEVMLLAERAIVMLKSVLSCKACYRFTDICVPDSGTVDFGFMQVQSKALAKHLKDSKQACIFAATIGIEADRLIFRTKHSEPSLALALQAAGAAAIESYCDSLCASVLEKEIREPGLHLGKRFSAGYADLSLEYQKEICAALDCTRKIGLTLTEGYMMMPSKSVTAFVGVGNKKACSENKCSTCENINCVFRKDSDSK